MRLPFVLTALLAGFASLAEANPITLPLARHFNLTGSAKILENDQARAHLLKANSANKHSQRSVYPVTLTNEAVIYTVVVSKLR